MISQLNTWQMVQPSQLGVDSETLLEGRFEQTSIPLPELKRDEVVIEIAGCGVCGSDISFFYSGVPTASKPPLTLGHEISGVVIAGEDQWIGKNVVVPTILPCGKCELCQSGRANRCLSQKMPGNSLGIHGGFSSHIIVPSRDLCVIPENSDFSLAELSVVADAVATPYQAAKRGELGEGDRIIIIGVTGGLGVYMAQWAKLMGVEAVIGIGRDATKLERALQYGCDAVIDSGQNSIWEVQKAFSTFCRERRLNSRCCWKVFEMSGTRLGQELALELLRYSGMLLVVGYSTANLSYNFSRLSALDAEIRGTWGCLPEYYPHILDEVLKRNIQIKPFVQERPMTQIRESFREHHEKGSPMKRVVLTPDFS